MATEILGMTARCQHCGELFTPLIPQRLEEDNVRGLPVLCEKDRYAHTPKELRQQELR